MKCPTCGAWSEVLESRAAPNHMTKRRRQCANGHRFNTFEVLPTALSKRDARATAVAAAKRARMWERDQAIRRDPRTASQLAAVHRISEARVRQIRAC